MFYKVELRYQNIMFTIKILLIKSNAFQSYAVRFQYVRLSQIMNFKDVKPKLKNVHKLKAYIL